MKFILILFSLLSLSCSCNCFAVINRDIRFLTMQEGLSDNTINSIFKDNNGFIWFGTDNGLNRFDGRNIRKFDFKNMQQIDKIYEADDTFLWIISKQMLYAFDRKRECFLPVKWEHSNEPVSTRMLLKDKQGNHWGLLSHVFFSFKITEARQNRLSISKKEEKISPPETVPFSAFCLSEDSTRIYIANNRQGILAFSLQTNQLSILTDSREKQKSATVSAMTIDGKSIWMSTVGQGVLRYDLPSETYRQFIYREEKPYSSLSHVSAYALLKLNSSTLFVPTWNGYTLLQTDKETSDDDVSCEIWDNNAFTDFPTLETRMISAYYDPKGILWIGTRGGGVLMQNIREPFFKQYNQKRHNAIYNIIADREKHIWLLTYHKGLMKSKKPFPGNEKALDFVTVNTGYNQDDLIPLSAMQDLDGNLWFGYTSSLLACWSASEQRIHNYDLTAYKSSDGKSPMNINAIYEDNPGRIWLGTSNGIFHFNPHSGQCRAVPLVLNDEKQSLNITSIAKGKDKILWLGTNKGLWRLSIENGQIRTIRTGYEDSLQLKTKYINKILATDKDELYIGYSGGFAIVSQSQNRLTDYYTTKNGLPNNEITCIVEDKAGHIWLGSNSGVTRYSRHQKCFYNYYISSSNSSAEQIADYLFFGNNKSLTYFNPEEVLKTSETAPVQFIDLYVNHTEVKVNEEINNQQILENNLSYTNRLLLSYANRDFSLSFSTLSFENDKQQYLYRLLPYQQNWILCHEGEKASYTNLPEGEYRFEVKAVYPDDLIGETSRLLITIQPHWSKSLWFRSLVIASVFLLFYLIYLRVKKKQLRIQYEMQLKHELEITSIEREKEKQIREEREMFFTSSAHELRTPLTLILGPLQELLGYESLPEEVQCKMKVAEKNARSLLSLTNQLLYIQKIEADMVQLNVTETDLKELLEQECLSFETLALRQNRTFRSMLGKNTAPLWGDPEKIISAVRNLLANAFKYTSPGGDISLSLSEENEGETAFYVIAVKDNGKGIPQSIQKHIFDPFVTGSENPSFSDKTGIGLRIVKNTMDLHHGKVILESSEGQGSTFKLFIPKGKAHFSENEVKATATGLQDMELPSPSKKLSILIIEDNPEIRTYINNLLANEYQIWEAADGEEGAMMAKDKLPDLIVSDVIMPNKDGFECCKEIRSYPQTAHIPIIMLTAKAEDADKIHGSLIGADDYLMKPFNPELLKTRIKTLIRQRIHLKRIYTKALMLKESYKEDRQSEKDLFIERIISIIEANISNCAFGVKDVAESMNMSQATLYRKLKQNTNLSIVEVVRNVRISKAATLILTQKYTIQEVAEMVGFNDLPTFRKYFTKQFGVSPSRYLTPQQ